MGGAGRTTTEGGRQSLRILLAVGALGFSSVITQLALMRELLGAFSGNEMVLGVILGNWLLLTGLGAALGRVTDRLRSRRSATLQTTFAVGLILIAIVPLAQVYLLRVLRNVVFIRGASVGVTETVTASFVLLSPYCLVSGSLLTLACAIQACRAGVSPAHSNSVTAAGETPALLGTENGSAIGRVYVADSIGSIVGGVLFSFVLVRWLDHFAMLYLPALLNLAMAGVLAWNSTVAAPFMGAQSSAESKAAQAEACGYNARRGWRLVSVAAIITLAVVAMMLLTEMDAVSTAKQYPGQRIVFRKNSPYGKLIVTESAGQFDFIENGLPILSTYNVEQVEETVHYAMAQRPDARKVLLVSGGVSGTAREILKYNVGEVDYVELDPLIIELGRKYLPDSLADARIKVVNTDGRLFVKQVAYNRRLSREIQPDGPPGGPSLPENADDTYDVVIVDAPDPSTSQINRFFTTEFYGEVKRVLSRDGVVAFALGRYENYISPQLAALLASAYATVKPLFANVLLIPGGRVYFLASNGSLSTNIAARLEQRGVGTRLVNRHYLDAMLTADRVEDLRRAVSTASVVNRDFKPVLYFLHLRYWMSQFQARFRALVTGLLVALAVYVFTLRPVPLAIFFSGFAASALEVVLLLGFQILCGSLYHQVGVIVTMFMVGLAVGAWMANRRVIRSDTNPHPDLLRSRKAEGDSSAVSSGERIEVRGQSVPTGDWEAMRLLAKLSFAIAAYSALLPLIFVGLEHISAGAISSTAVRAAIAMLTFVLAALVGMEFPLASRVQFEGAARTASRLYTADFVGAFLGALVASVLLIPMIGVTAVCWLTAGLNVLGGAGILLRKAG